MANQDAPLSDEIIERYEQSLIRCSSCKNFLDEFYDRFRASSPEVAEKFAGTDFAKQKRALRASFFLIVSAIGDKSGGPEHYLKDVAIRHSRKHLDVGAALYDLWLDSLLATVKSCDPECDPYVLHAWEQVMVKGIHYMLGFYNHP
jgi:hemoglobin-like flavoprotein